MLLNILPAAISAMVHRVPGKLEAASFAVC
jgi:hypothetical protein